MPLSTLGGTTTSRPARARFSAPAPRPYRPNALAARLGADRPPEPDDDEAPRAAAAADRQREREEAVAAERAEHLARPGLDPTLRLLLEAIPSAVPVNDAEQAAIDAARARRPAPTPEEAEREDARLAALQEKRARLEALPPSVPPPPMPEGWMRDAAWMLGVPRQVTVRQEGRWQARCCVKRLHDSWRERGVGTLAGYNNERLNPEVFADALLETGWPWYPQNRTSGLRAPVGGYYDAEPDPEGGPAPEGKRVYSISPKVIARAAVDAAEVGSWLGTLAQRKTDANVAVALGGPASAYLGAVDIDVDDAALVARIRRIAEEELGATPYVRGRDKSEKIALLYRGEALDALRGFRDVKLADKRGAVEFKFSAAMSLTLLGLHHGSQRPFRWESLTPGVDADATPDRATLVTRDRLAAFADRLRQDLADVLDPVQPRSGPIGGRVTAVEDDDTDDPGPRNIDITGLHAIDPRMDRTEQIKEGREPYLYHALVRGLVNLPGNAHADKDQLTKLAYRLAKEQIYCGGWEDLRYNDLWELVADRVSRTFDNREDRRRAGKWRPTATVTAADGTVHAASSVDYAMPGVEPADMLRLLVPESVPCTRVMSLVATPPDAALAADRALLSGVAREAMLAGVAASVADAPRRWLLQDVVPRLPDDRKDKLALRREASAPHDAEAARCREAGDHGGEVAAIRAGRAAADAAAMTKPPTGAPPVWLLRGPTGSGKTRAALQALVDVKRMLARQGRKLGAVVMMVPSHSLAADVAQRAEATTPTPEEDAAVRAAAAEAAGMGLKVMTYQGKGRLCSVPEQKTLAAAGINTAGLCEARRRIHVPGEGWVTRLYECDEKVNGTCLFHAQKRAAPGCDLILMPSAYATLPWAREVRDAAVAVIVDESIVSQALAVAHMPVSALGLTRVVPRVRKADVAAGVDAGRMMHSRAELAEVATAALLAGRDVAGALLAWAAANGIDAGILRGMVTHARDVCGRAMDYHDDVSPDMTAFAAQELADRRRRSVALAEERRFWCLVGERLDWLAAGTARGDRDVRLQVRREGGVGEPTVRMSWRRKLSFGDLPVLHMDASADVEITRKLFHPRSVHVVDVAARPHMRVLLVPDVTASDSSMLPHRARDPMDAGRMLDHVRRLVDGVAMAVGGGRVGVASTLTVEMALNTGWCAPPNSDWLHFNNCVGFDHLRLHKAMVVVGRQELPIPVVDGLVAALTYDDPEPEMPVDRLGTGLDAAGREVRAERGERRLRRRDGSDLVIPDLTYAGAWACRIQRQAREAQVWQAIGRLRPVYRDGDPPLLVYVGRALPGDIVVDAVAALEHVTGSAAVDLATDMRVHGVASWDAPMLPRALALYALRGEYRGGTAPVYATAAEVRWTVGPVGFRGWVPAWESPAGVEARVRRWCAVAVPGLSQVPDGAALGAVEVVARPARDDAAAAIARGPDPKMIERLGPMDERAACESAALTRALEVAHAIDGLWCEDRAAPRAAGRRAPQRPDEADRAPRRLSALAAVLTVGPRGIGRANVVETLFRPAGSLPEVVGRAVARLTDDAAPVEDVEAGAPAWGEPADEPWCEPDDRGVRVSGP